MDEDRPLDAPRRHGLTAIDGAIALMVILLIVQMWLLMATVNSFLAGMRAAALPAAIASAILSLACLGLVVFIEGVDRSSRERT